MIEYDTPGRIVECLHQILRNHLEMNYVGKVGILWSQDPYYLYVVVVFLLLLGTHSKILLENSQNWKLSKLKVVRIENCQNCKLPKLQVAKIACCQNWKLSKLKVAKIRNCQNWKLPTLKVISVFLAKG
jgi:hypothetical protein